MTVFEPINTDRESYVLGVSGRETMKLTEMASKKSTSKLIEEKERSRNMIYNPENTLMKREGDKLFCRTQFLERHLTTS